MEETRTRRQALEDLLRSGEHTLRDLAVALGRPLREVEADLTHVARSQGRRRLRIVPAVCLACGFVFQKRERVTSPSRCPRCRSEHVDPPRVSLSG